MAYTYRVETVCAATIRESWTIESPDPLSREAIAQALVTRGPTVTALEDETRLIEAQRTIVTLERLHDRKDPRCH